jgi:hypothetical protein
MLDATALIYFRAADKKHRHIYRVVLSYSIRIYRHRHLPTATAAYGTNFSLAVFCKRQFQSTFFASMIKLD